MRLPRISPAAAGFLAMPSTAALRPRACEIAPNAAAIASANPAVMIDQRTTPTTDEIEGVGSRQRAIEAFERARDRTVDTLAEAPLIAIAGGIAAGALIAALLPRTEAEARAIRPTARRVRNSAKAAYKAAKDTGSQRLDELGLTREKGEETIRNLLEGITDAAKASANAAVDAARNADKG